jgi:2-polyprenyl-6-methoxyphenol hydroxylase-like FAD-dependent oxidoreductase
MTPVPSRSAVVVGAGIGGLAAAGALARTGWRVTLLERADRLRTAPIALLLWPGGVRALQALGLGAGLAAIATVVPDAGLRRPDGQWLVPPRRSVTGAEPLLVHAEDLHDALIAGLGDRIEVRTGVAVRPARPTADGRPAVTDGDTTWEADLVVAADGIDSALRVAVAPRSVPVAAGATTWQAVIPWYRAPELPQDLAGPVVAQKGGYRFRTAALGERSSSGGSGRGGIYWSATGPGAPRPEPVGTRLELLRRWFAGWHPPIPQLLTATEPEDVVQRELRALRPRPDRLAVPAGPGAVVLVGDAGHAIAEHLGQGACLAVEDAATLVAAVHAAVPGGPLHTAVTTYQRARLARVAEVWRRTRQLGDTGRLSGWGRLQARRREQAAATAGAWHPPA